MHRKSWQDENKMSCKTLILIRNVIKEPQTPTESFFKQIPYLRNDRAHPDWHCLCLFFKPVGCPYVWPLLSHQTEPLDCRSRSALWWASESQLGMNSKCIQGGPQITPPSPISLPHNDLWHKMLWLEMFQFFCCFLSPFFLFYLLNIYF